MPRYDYRCDKCEAVIEVSHKIDDTPAIKCPKGHKMKRMLGTFGGMIFKGPGFYATDYPKKN